MQVGCEVGSQHTWMQLPPCKHTYISSIFSLWLSLSPIPSQSHRHIERGQAEWTTEVKGWISQHLLPQPLTICLSGNSLPLLRLNSKLADAKQSLREERFRWVNLNSYIVCYTLWLSAYWKQDEKKMWNTTKLEPWNLAIQQTGMEKGVR